MGNLEQLHCGNARLASCTLHVRCQKIDTAYTKICTTNMQHLRRTPVSGEKTINQDTTT